MAKKPETVICEKIMEAVRDLGGFCIHVPGSIKQANQPDLDGAIRWEGADRWLHFKIEVKQPGEEARPAQQAMLDVWASYGYVTGTAHSVEEFLSIIRDYVIKERERISGDFRQTKRIGKG